MANNLNEMTSYMDFPLYETLQTQDRWLLVFLYSYQIYADFFGYSAIAIGLGLLFGYRLPINFNLPYISISFSEFWTRWHISLSSWLRTYLYVPLGGNRHGVLQNLSEFDDRDGAWRPLAWRRLGYLLWGLLHGALLVLERPLLARLASIDSAAFPDGADGRGLCLRQHALDFLQAAELRSCSQLFVRHVHAQHESQSDRSCSMIWRCSIRCRS